MVDETAVEQIAVDAVENQPAEITPLVESAKKKIKDLSPAELKAYNQVKTQQSRERKAAAKSAEDAKYNSKIIPTKAEDKE